MKKIRAHLRFVGAADLNVSFNAFFLFKWSFGAYIVLTYLDLVHSVPIST